MTRIATTTEISRPAAEIFDYVTTPSSWPRWHPSSLAVSGATDHSLRLGEQVAEEFRVAGRRGSVVWTVREALPPVRWTIEGEVAGHSGGGTVTYALAPIPGGTRFWRELAYELPGPVARALDWLVLRRRVDAESAEALRRLKAVLEGGEVPAPGPTSSRSILLPLAAAGCLAAALAYRLGRRARCRVVG